MDTGGEVGGVLRDQDVGAGLSKLGEVDLVLDEDSEVGHGGEEGPRGSQGEDVTLYRTPGMDHAGQRAQVTHAGQHTMGCS